MAHTTVGRISKIAHLDHPTVTRYNNKTINLSQKNEECINRRLKLGANIIEI